MDVCVSDRSGNPEVGWVGGRPELERIARPGIGMRVGRQRPNDGNIPETAQPIDTELSRLVVEGS